MKGNTSLSGSKKGNIKIKRLAKPSGQELIAHSNLESQLPHNSRSWQHKLESNLRSKCDDNEDEVITSPLISPIYKESKASNARNSKPNIREEFTFSPRNKNEESDQSALRDEVQKLLVENKNLVKRYD